MASGTGSGMQQGSRPARNPPRVAVLAKTMPYALHPAGISRRRHLKNIDPQFYPVYRKPQGAIHADTP